MDSLKVTPVAFLVANFNCSSYLSDNFMFTLFHYVICIKILLNLNRFLK